MLSRPRTQASRNAQVCGESEPKSIRFCRGQGVGGELADGQRRAVDRQRRDHGVHAAAVGEAGVHHRARLVHATADPGHDLVDGAPQVRLVTELGVGLRQPTLLLQPDGVETVDHHLGDVRVAQVGLDRPVAQDVVADLLGDLGAVAVAERSVLRGEHIAEYGAHPLVELLLVHVRGVQRRAQLLEQLGVDRRLDGLEPVRGGLCLGAERRRLLRLQALLVRRLLLVRRHWRRHPTTDCGSGWWRCLGDRRRHPAAGDEPVSVRGLGVGGDALRRQLAVGVRRLVGAFLLVARRRAGLAGRSEPVAETGHVIHLRIRNRRPDLSSDSGSAVSRPDCGAAG